MLVVSSDSVYSNFIAQLEEHRTVIAKIMGSNSIEAFEEFFLGFFRSCFSCFITAS